MILNSNLVFFKLKLKSVCMVFVFTLCFILLSSATVNSQNLSDSIKYANHSPHKATIYSMVLPGLGQVYNKQYWKVPVLYAGIATIVYFVSFNTERYHKYRDEYVARINGDTLALNPSFALYTTSSVLQVKNYYQRNLEFTYIMAGVVYLLNIIDASVYAHLFAFDVSNNLSFRIDPLFNNNSFRLDSPPSAGFKLTFRF